MKAGHYTATVYKKQLAVGTASYLINAGATKTQSISVSLNMTSKPIWRIGAWDGTPDGFLNADKIHKMHPSDYRMSAWKTMTFKAGSDADSAFSMAQTLKIGLTLAQSSGRSSVTVNGKWTAAVPASVAVKTRGVTRGVIVGNYNLYEYVIPSSALATGTNSIKLTVASGATDPSEKFLAASVVFDALELV
ncbi:polysaccharide lyase, putative [Phytophthora infestans T30-4]|uniref:Polysaccharide lyase, putative n=1 Tax=Phytophthora infestans (strain T30-4) TaxID=403677 RepID=D0MW21_PHYIT|nr:polysaccharide lyase, putative [Phytophthora infestans T30-4]EEY63834.1 polysaccharide lyase, putative [Phytophthora infestans T30-4]|eukprot:XP_002907270.1 polysaccharide lyase, putative [Phytophthora infestans T30-4]